MILAILICSLLFSEAGALPQAVFVPVVRPVHVKQRPLHGVEAVVNRVMFFCTALLICAPLYVKDPFGKNDALVCRMVITGLVSALLWMVYTAE